MSEEKDHYSERLLELARLQRGWLGQGEGERVSWDSLVAASRFLGSWAGETLYVYPTPDGRISIESDMPGFEDMVLR